MGPRLTFDIVIVPDLWLKVGLGEVNVALLVIGGGSPTSVFLRSGHDGSVCLELLQCSG